MNPVREAALPGEIRIQYEINVSEVD